MGEALPPDRYRKRQDLTAEGLYQMAAEEVRRPGSPRAPHRRFLDSLAQALDLEASVAREIEDLAERKRAEGRLGHRRAYDPRQLYARALRYAYWDGDPPDAVMELFAGLRACVGYVEEDHDALMEELIDKGWAPPKGYTPLVVTGEGIQRPGPVGPDLFETMSDLPAAASLGLGEPPAPPPRAETPREEPPAPEGAAPPASSPAAAPAAPPPRVDPRLALGIGVAFGLLVGLVPISYLLGRLSGRGPEAPPVAAAPVPVAPAAPAPPPSPREPAGARPPAPAAEAARSPPSEASPPAAASEDLFSELPPSGQDLSSGVVLVGELLRVLTGAGPAAGAALERYTATRGEEAERRFVAWTEESFLLEPGSEADEGRAVALLDEVEALLAALPSRSVPTPESWQAAFLGVLAFCAPLESYAGRPWVYRNLAPRLRRAVEALPQLRSSTLARPLRVIGEDLVDSGSPELAEEGAALLEALEEETG